MGLISVWLAENTRRSVRRAVHSGELRAAIIPLGSTEQHNEYLAMGFDAGIVGLIAERAALALFPAVIVAPVLSIGVSEHWMEHPGTLTLSEAVFAQMVFEVCQSLRRHGLERILLLNGHGGNRAAISSRLDDFRRRLGGSLVFHSYWEAYTPEEVQRLLVTGECPGHAGEFEVSLAMAALPTWMYAADDTYPEHELSIADPNRAAADRRFFEGSHLATAEKGRTLLGIAVAWVVGRLRCLLSA